MRSGTIGETPTDGRPAVDWRCEACGYPLSDAVPDGDCPECGRAVLDSSPARRTGPAWRHQRHPVAWLQTAGALATRPRRFFRTLDLTGGNGAARVFLAINVACCVAGLTAALAWTGDLPGALVWGYAMVAGKAIVALTYLEAAGVAFFSKQHGWPITLARAERLACYASVGWFPAVLGLWLAWRGTQSDAFADWAARAGLPTAAEPIGWAVVLVGFGVAILGFELLVWVGVRATRFAAIPRLETPPASRPPGV